jgi:diguanylate cyclase (GGDEF)-like protein
MSMVRQVWLLIACTLILAFAGGFGLSMLSSREFLIQQVSARSNDMAQSLALTLSQAGSDEDSKALLLAAQFDTGFYDSIRWLDVDGQVKMARQHEQPRGQVPPWFRRLMRLDTEPGLALISQGWLQQGRVEVRATAGQALEHLWQGARWAAGLFVVLMLLIGGLAHRGLLAVMRPLRSTVEQANALGERRFVSAPEPRTPELRQVTRAMNGLVERIKAMFDQQAVQVEDLYRQAHFDALTGVFNRPHFLARSAQVLEAESGASHGVLVMVRLQDPAGLNRTLGRMVVDALLRRVAAELTQAVQTVPGAVLGRLNGFEFAIMLPHVAASQEVAERAAARMRLVSQRHPGAVRMAIGAVAWSGGGALSTLLAAADEVLARAELMPPFEPHCSEVASPGLEGESVWRQRLQEAITSGPERHTLAAFPVLGRGGELLYLECPLRLRWGETEPWVSAAQWLPMACRTEWVAQADLLAFHAALQASDSDGQARGVFVSMASICKPSFLPELRRALQTHAHGAALLRVAVPERAVVEALPELRQLCSVCHAHGVKVGLDQAGEEIHQSSAVLEAGLDFVKVQASLIQGVSQAAQQRQHLRGLCHLLHGAGIQVLAAGVSEAADTEALAAIGLDGWTGPAVKAPAST